MHKTVLGFLATLSLVSPAAALAQVDQRTDNVIRGVNYIGVSVSDIERAVEYYSGATDLQLVEEGRLQGQAVFDQIAGREGVAAETKLLRGVNAQLQFMEFEDPSAEALASPHIEVKGPGIAHVCFQVNGTTSTYQRFLAAGAMPIGEPEMVPLNPRNPVEYAYARDADGIIAEVEHIDFSKLSTSRDHDYRIRHVSLATPDMERMVNFYSVLMEEPEPRRARGLSGENFDKVSGYTDSEIEMSWFQVRNLELEIIRIASHPAEDLTKPRPLDAYGYNMIMFDVLSIEAARAKLIEAGGAVIGTPSKLDGGEVIFGRDPDGNLLGFQAIDAAATVSSQNFADNGS